MKALFKILTLVGSLAMSYQAHAQSSGGGGGAGGRKEAFMSAGFIGLSSSATEYDLSPGLSFIPLQTWSWLQASAEITYQKIGYRAGTSSNLIILVGPTFNLGAFLTDSFFISLGAAYRSGASDYVDSVTIDPNGFGFYFFAGKRFPIAGSFSLRPSLGVVACGTTGMVFRPFAVSYQF